ncbi:MAG: T9SS type A sorting domain-containing protein [Ignavibacteriaceae bacterium]|nr:T9SS type A sorting domain-containing protein [Ignavibacteria bacterium]MBT8390453.1 T9SS type A sorting domain-containing protein [Ignavibacteria bacterium]NNJ52929.1 T9SS type A sorting domain-containing protein [Ignavibacteriaceae bacterium]NNL21364.1 T9SS type A sorting domain-containing protein [Ignavibacteriaceae bacterium]
MKMNCYLFIVLLSAILLSSNLNAQWVNTGSPFGGYVHTIATDESNIFIGTDQGGIYRSTDSGSNWTQVNSGLTTTSIKALAFAGSDIFAGTSTGGIFRSSDRGLNWTEVNTGLSVLFINTLAVSGSNIFAGARYSVTGGGVFLSTNNGDSWTYVGLTDYEIYSIVISGNNIFAGTDNGVYLSTDNGTNWTEVNSGLTESDVYALKISNNKLYAGTPNGLFYSSDNGSNWTNINSSTLDNISIRSIAIHQVNIIVGSDGWGVYVSTDNGSTWEESDTGLPNSFVAIHALTTSGTKIYAGSLFIGAWERPLTDYLTDVEKTSDILPHSFNLAQNYPNPFNPSTTIEFSILEESFVELKVFDVLGNEVALLANDNYAAGTYKTDFSNTNLTSGTYFYRLEAGSFVEIKKMLLLK